MNGLLRRRSNAEEEHTRRVFPRENETPKISVPCEKKPIALRRLPEERTVRGRGQTEVGRRYDIVPISRQGADCCCPYVMVGEKRHEDGVDT